MELLNVGDRVALNKAALSVSYIVARQSYTNMFVGKTGTIIGISSGDFKKYAIEFDTIVFTNGKKRSTHDNGCNGKGKDHYCWYIPIDCVDLIPKTINPLSLDGANCDSPWISEECGHMPPSIANSIADVVERHNAEDKKEFESKTKIHTINGNRSTPLSDLLLGSNDLSADTRFEWNVFKYHEAERKRHTDALDGVIKTLSAIADANTLEYDYYITLIS